MNRNTRPTKFHILIVDDNSRFVERMIGLLDEGKNMGYINVASDYDEAKRYLEEKPDIVLLDINLPGKNGINLLKKIKESGMESKVIMLTNHADEYYKQQCVMLGADYFLDKSSDFAKVPAIIKMLSPVFNTYI